MTITTRIALAAAAAALTLAQPVLAQAHDYRRHQDDCTDRVHRNGTTGAIVGGLAGAALGANVASSRNQTEGALIGAAAGAAVGSNIARSSTKSRCRGDDRDYRPVYYAPTYYDPPPPPRYRHDNGLHRGWYKHHGHDD